MCLYPLWQFKEDFLKSLGEENYKTYIEQYENDDADIQGQKGIVMGLQLHETVYGKNFFEHQLPSLIKAINRLADAVEKQNELSKEQTKEE